MGLLNRSSLPDPTIDSRKVIDQQAALIEKQRRTIAAQEKREESREWDNAWDQVKADEESAKARLDQLGTAIGPFRTVNCHCYRESSSEIRQYGVVRCFHCPAAFTDQADFDAHKSKHHELVDWF